MTDITVFWDDEFLEHEPPAGEFEAEWTGRIAVKEPHPDRKERVQNIKHILEHSLADHINWEAVNPITDKRLYRVHSPPYVEEFKEFCESGGGRLTAETGANEASCKAARYAAGAAVDAAEAAFDTNDTPYALVRPSGHHAQSTQADGFCFFNNTAVAAEHLRATDRADKVAILDWDVHHGNGTQEIFYDRSDVLFISLHNDHWSWDPDSHPQTGDITEYGVNDGNGYNLNVPLPPGTGNKGYAYAFDHIVEPVIGAFKPDILLVSAGQDPGTMDPLGRNIVTKEGFEDFGRRARNIATEHTENRLAIIQEGGYQISHLPYATLGVLEGVSGIKTGIEDPFAWLDEDFKSAQREIDQIAEQFADDWPTKP